MTDTLHTREGIATLPRTRQWPAGPHTDVSLAGHWVIQVAVEPYDT